MDIKNNSALTQNYIIKKRSLILCTIFSFLSLQIYTWVWLYKICKESIKVFSDGEDKKLKNFYICALIFYWTGIILIIAAYAAVSVNAVALTDYSLLFDYLLVDEQLFIIYLSLSALGIVLLACSVIFQCLISYRLAKLSGANGYDRFCYVFASWILGIWCPALFVQSTLNCYSGVYAENERPVYLHNCAELMH